MTEHFKKTPKSVSIAIVSVLISSISEVGGGIQSDCEACEYKHRFLHKRSAPAYLGNNLEATFSPLEALIPKVDSQAYFDTKNNTHVTAQVGSTAYLPCTIYNIGDGTVSWIRRKDYHLLTVGLTNYVADERFQSVHYQHSVNWTLIIKYIQPRDRGIYECQISSHPPISNFIHVIVVEAKASILGPPDKFLKPGSTLHLQCIILNTTESPSYIFWFHNDRMINYDKDRGVNVTTDYDHRTSDLVIPNASSGNTGNYSCQPNIAASASTFVHVVYGENPAAMQSASSFSCYSCVGYSAIASATHLLFTKLLR